MEHEKKNEPGDDHAWLVNLLEVMQRLKHCDYEC